MRGMVIDMQEARLHTLAQFKAFLEGTAEVEPSASPRTGALPVYRTRAHAVRLCAARAGGQECAAPLSGAHTRLSRQQLTRLVRQYRRDGTLSCRAIARTPARFPRRFTAADVALLADTDALHGTAVGAGHQAVDAARLPGVRGMPATSGLAGDLGGAPVQPARAGRLPGSAAGLDQDPAAQGVPIGERRAPAPEGAAGLHPHRQRASGRSGRAQGRLSHQRGGLRDAVRAGGHLRAHQRGVPAAGDPAAARRTSLSRSWAFMPTTARSTSTTRWPSCSTSCASSSPNRARGTATTTPWPKPRTGPSCASTWATPHPATLRPRSMPSARTSSTRT